MSLAAHPSALGRCSLWAAVVALVAVGLVACEDAAADDVAHGDSGGDARAVASSDGGSDAGAADAVDAGDSDVAERWLETASPESVGMDSALLERAREYAFERGRNTQAVVVVRRGAIVAEWYAEGRDASSLCASWSVAKSMASAVIGVALERGEIPSVDEPMTTYIPEWAGTEREEILLRDVLEMASGLAWVEDYEVGSISESDVAEMVLDREGSQLAIVTDNAVEHAPGARFNYSSGDAMLLSHVIEVATGESAGEYAQTHLFAPLGIDGARWWRDPSGDTLTYCCADMTARDFARFGQLYLDGGSFAGRQVVAAAWVEASTEPSRAYGGYGYQWWLTGRTDEGLPADTFSALGYDGQYVHVIPSLELVVVRMGMYWPHEGEAVAEPSLFAVYPSGGLLAEMGTVPPEEWSTAEFMGAILESVRD